jgi:hypothetical protein
VLTDDIECASLPGVCNEARPCAVNREGDAGTSEAGCKNNRINGERLTLVRLHDKSGGLAVDGTHRRPVMRHGRASDHFSSSGGLQGIFHVMAVKPSREVGIGVGRSGQRVAMPCTMPAAPVEKVVGTIGPQTHAIGRDV